jgi:hypothetical protein
MIYDCYKANMDTASKKGETHERMAEICDSLLVDVIATLNINLGCHLHPSFPRLLGYCPVKRLLHDERTNASGQGLQTPQQLTDVLEPVSIEFLKQNPDDFPFHNALKQALLQNGVKGSMWTLACRLHNRGNFAIYPPRCEPTEYVSVAKEYARIRGLDSSATAGFIALAAKVVNSDSMWHCCIRSCTYIFV